MKNSRFRLLLLLPGIALTFSTVTSQVNFTSSNLPIILIDTHGQNIPYDNPRIVADMKIISNDIGQRNRVFDPPNNYSGRISIEIRGASSAGWLKKSYAFETQHVDGSNRTVSLLGFPEENDWILYAPYYDRSLLRNVLVYKLARDMGRYASRTKFCALVLNGEYQGVYVLMEKIKVDKNRVNISKLNPHEISGDDVTGGYIIKIDKDDWQPGFTSKYPPFSGATQKIIYQYHYPKGDEIVAEQEKYIHDFMDAFEGAMTKANYADSATGYPRYIDTPSFVDYFLLNEISKNVDAYRLSAYLHKDRDSKGGKLIAGPVWDYNFSFGNVAYYSAEFIPGWILDGLMIHGRYDHWLVPFWWKRLASEEKFANRVFQRWTELRAVILNNDRLHHYIDAVADTLDEAQARNFQIWIGPGDPQRPEDGWWPPDDPIRGFQTYQDEIDYLKSWLDQRLLWMDKAIINFKNISYEQTSSVPSAISLAQNYPNPFNPGTTIQFSLPEAEKVTVELFNALGQKVETLIHEYKQAGYHAIDLNAAHLSSGLYFYRLHAGSFTSTRKMMLLR